jgi:hypothetical protein
MVWDYFQCRDVRTKFYENRPRGSSDEREVPGLTHRQHGDKVSVIIFRKKGK